MIRRNWFTIALLFLALFAFTYDSAKGDRDDVVGSSNYEDLVSLFEEWREFQKPRITEGVPDYTAAAMEEQKRGLEKYQSRLAAIDCSSWPVSQQVDYHIVRAEMNGLEFDHRVLRPWSRNPCFYVVINKSEPDVPAREGPEVYGSLLLPKLPLPDKNIAEFRMKLQAIPKILEQAKVNLTEEAKDLWFLGILVKKRESAWLSDLTKNLADHHLDLVPEAERAKAAVDEFLDWLEEKQSGMTARSGIGIENYNWYMKNVHLVPYTWEEQLVIVQRELKRALSCLKLEENRNRKLAKLEPVKNEEERRRLYNETENYFMEFLREEEIFTVPDYLHSFGVKGPFIPLSSDSSFFMQVLYRDPLPMRGHGTHTFDKLREEHEPHPSSIRRVPLLYNIWDTRAEGLATAMEEMMMHAGLLDKRERTRELVYIQLAHRAARAMADLKMHSNEFTVEDAVNFAVEWTPNGWMPKNAGAWIEMKIYLHQPGYGASYVVGKAQIDKFLADRAHQLGEKFTLKQFMDEFYASGMIPITLTRWEIAGREDVIKKLW